MSAKFSAQRARAFLTYLAQTGNQTLSAERAKVSRSWVCLHRSADPEFDAACRAAFRQAQDRLIEQAKGKLKTPPLPARGLGEAPSPSKGRGANQPPCRGWRYLDGAELVVRGTGGAGGGKRVQIARARLRQWTPRVEDRFLAALAASCNVKAACAEAGMSTGSAYAHRARWPAFERRWDEAVETGYARIEAALAEAACNLFSAPAGLLETSPIKDMTAADAFHLLHMHKQQMHGLGKQPGLKMAHDKKVELARRNLEQRMRRMGLLPR